MKFKDLVQENGHLTKDGKEVVSISLETLEVLIDNSGPTLSELETLQAVILKEISDLFSRKILDKRNK